MYRLLDFLYISYVYSEYSGLYFAYIKFLYQIILPPQTTINPINLKLNERKLLIYVRS